MLYQLLFVDLFHTYCMGMSCFLNYQYCLLCRYHFNVMDSRLYQHAEKGKEDGLYISCIASSGNLWAVVMDAVTVFTSQVYELSPVFLRKVSVNVLTLSSDDFASQRYVLPLSPSFLILDQEWIMEQWDKNYYITSFAGACNGSAFVVMSKGEWKRLFLGVLSKFTMVL